MRLPTVHVKLVSYVDYLCADAEQIVRRALVSSVVCKDALICLCPWKLKTLAHPAAETRIGRVPFYCTVVGTAVHNRTHVGTKNRARYLLQAKRWPVTRRSPGCSDLDSLYLCSMDRCVLQMGGSDQWGNMVNGVDLGRRVEQAELFALTAPLITTSEGKKMGKSASGAVWLNADKLPVYDYWQVSLCAVVYLLPHLIQSNAVGCLYRSVARQFAARECVVLFPCIESVAFPVGEKHRPRTLETQEL